MERLNRENMRLLTVIGTTRWVMRGFTRRSDTTAGHGDLGNRSDPHCEGGDTIIAERHQLQGVRNGGGVLFL